ncbi:AI-2E family transporter [Lusitaniella coriacea LEGE 07157]|uniref:AI-2E family transporter n=1 Tax=Lusitaniella coriacea LEGE 07157 TaxID=945747 RepID=A0A8J7B3S4_9CYAN|nr:AI-2E family transporter [Lusitaniella coriacea]MBE9115292.1 AI-2E family transporter [Lusitaniella coriacea LEGE 07157]
MSERRITISTSTLLWVGIVGLLAILLWQLQGLLLVLAIAVVIASTLAPVIQRAQRWGIPRWLAVFLVYIGLIAGLIGVGSIVGVPAIDQIQRLIRNLPGYLDVLESLTEDLVMRTGTIDPVTLEQIRQFFDLQAIATWAFRSSQQLLIRSYSVTRGLLGGAFSVILALLLSIYMLIGSEQLVQGILRLFPSPWNERLAAQVQPMGQRMGGYIQGRILVSTILAVVISIGLNFLGLSEFSLGLGAIAGLTNLIPFFGPVLGSIPALIVAIAQGGWTFLWVLLLFLMIQNLETYLLDPLLVGSTVRIPPLYQLLAVLGGAQVLGIIGALIVPPWVAGISVLLENLYLKPKLQAELEEGDICDDVGTRGRGDAVRNS